MNRAGFLDATCGNGWPARSNGRTRNNAELYEAPWSTDGQGQRQVRADRQPGEMLALGGLPDAVGSLQVEPEPACGQWPGCPYGPGRRKIRWHTTCNAVQMLRGIRVINTERTLRASDHLPAVLSIEAHADDA